MASRDLTVKWLRGLAELGGKGVVHNIDARCLGRIADDLERLQKALAAVVHDVNEYERINRLAPTPGHVECWDSIARAKAVLADVGTVQVSGGDHG